MAEGVTPGLQQNMGTSGSRKQHHSGTRKSCVPGGLLPAGLPRLEVAERIHLAEEAAQRDLRRVGGVRLVVGQDVAHALRRAPGLIAAKYEQIQLIAIPT